MLQVKLTISSLDSYFSQMVVQVMNLFRVLGSFRVASLSLVAWKNAGFNAEEVQPEAAALILKPMAKSATVLDPVLKSRDNEI